MPTVQPEELDGDADEDVRVNVRTTREKRAEWKKFATEADIGQVDNLTDLVHRALGEFIARHEGDGDPYEVEATDGTTETTETDDTSQSVDFDAIRDALSDRDDRVKTQLDVLNERLSAIEEELTGQSEPDVAAKAVRRLPPERPETDAWEAAKPEEADPTDPIAWSGSVADVVTKSKINADAERVAEALDTLVTAGVAERAVIGGTARYWSDKSAANEGVDDPVPGHLMGPTTTDGGESQ